MSVKQSRKLHEPSIQEIEAKSHFDELGDDLVEDIAKKIDEIRGEEAVYQVFRQLVIRHHGAWVWAQGFKRWVHAPKSQ